MEKRLLVAAALVLSCLVAVDAQAIQVATEDMTLGVTGEFVLSGEKQVFESGGDESTWAEFDDEFEMVIRASKGGAAVVADLAVSDTSEADGYQGHYSTPVLLDNYWIEWAATDNLKFKAGEYALNFGRSIGVYDAGGRNLEVRYGLDAVDLSLAVGKVEEGKYQYLGSAIDEDQDVDHYVLTAAFKDLGPFSTLTATVVLEMDQIGATYGSSYQDDSYTANFVGVDFAAEAGPVALSGECGFLGGERYDGGMGEGSVDLKGTYVLLEAGLDSLMPEGFGLTVSLFDSNEDYNGPITQWDDWTPLEILFDEVNEAQAYTRALILSASYAYSERLTFNLALVPMASVNGDHDNVYLSTYGGLSSPRDGDSLGTEYDLGIEYAFSDNLTYSASYAKFTEGDVEFGDLTQYYNELSFTF